MTEKLKEVDVFGLGDNFISAIANDWMLITARKPDGSFNTMTASWGGVGCVWSKPVFTCVVRPQRYTYEFTEASDIITLSFFGGGYREALGICGSRSGRDCDKIALAGLTPAVCADCGAVWFEEASTVLVGRKLYSDMIREECFTDRSIPGRCYPDGDYHRLYVCEIIRAMKK